MYIVAIGGLSVVLKMVITAKNIAAGVMTFVFYGLAPSALLVWLTGTAQRRRNRSTAAAALVDHKKVKAPDRGDTESD